MSYDSSRIFKWRSALQPLAYIGLILLLVDAASAGGTEPERAVGDQKIVESYARLPLSFEVNQGQVGGQADFISRANGHTVILAANEVVLVLPAAAVEPATPRKALRHATAVPTPAAHAWPLQMRFENSNRHAQKSAVERLPGTANYFIGNDPAKWHTDVPTYAKVEYRDLYRGIDVIYYGTQREFEYDFVVSPGVDPRVIRLGFSRENRPRIDRATGDLILTAGGEEVRLLKPLVYQMTIAANEPPQKRIIEARYKSRGRHVGFQVDAYDKSLPLIIDPVLLAYSTFVGGNSDDHALGIAVDPDGNAYLAGETFFPRSGAVANFPTKIHTFVAKLNAAGTALLYSAYLAGSNGQGVNYAQSIAIDAAGCAYVSGTTFSTNFPTTLGAFQTAAAGAGDAFVTKFNPAGTRLVYSTYLGGSGYDIGGAIAVDADGNAYVTGSTQSSDFPTTRGALKTALTGSTTTAFVTKLDPAGAHLSYSTYLGGNNYDVGYGIAVDVAGHAHVAGYTASADFPTTANAFQRTAHGSTDAFIAKLDVHGARLLYSSYLGGVGDTLASGIALDRAGDVYLTGSTSSVDFPTTRGAAQTHLDGASDAFVAKLRMTEPHEAGLAYSTYLGGSNDDTAYAIAVDARGDAFVTGYTSSADFPTTANAYKRAFGGGTLDAFVTKLHRTGRRLLYSTYLGGQGDDYGNGIAVDRAGSAYVTGDTSSQDFPITPGAFQTKPQGTSAFVSKFVIDTEHCDPDGRGEHDCEEEH